jgi:hypothetical protein
MNELWELVLANSLSGNTYIQNCLKWLQICGDLNYLALVVQGQTTYTKCRGPKFKSRVVFHEDIFGSLFVRFYTIPEFEIFCCCSVQFKIKLHFLQYFFPSLLFPLLRIFDLFTYKQIHCMVLVSIS